MQSLRSILGPELFPNLSGRDLLQLCQVNIAFRQACQNEEVWFSKVLEEYLEYSDYKVDTMSWRQYYIGLIASHPVEVYYNNQIYMYPSTFVSRDEIKRNFESKLYFILDSNKRIIDIFNPNYAQNINSPTAKYIVLITDEISPDLNLYQVQIGGIIGVNRCTNSGLDSLIQSLVKMGYLPIQYLPEDESAYIGWVIVVEIFKISRLDLCRLISILSNLA